MRIFVFCAAVLSLSGANSAQARFLQADPVGYKDGINLYAYVDNDPINQLDPDGTTCVKVDKAYECKIDQVSRADGKPLTKNQQAAVKQFEQRYTRAVNQLMKDPSRSVTVKAFGEPKSGSFKITAGQAAGALIARQFGYTAGAKSPTPTTSMTTGGSYSPAYGTRGAFTRVYDYGLQNTASGGIVHEGLHSTPQEWKGGLQTFGYPLGQEPYRSGHQVPYGQAACSLLAGQDC